MIQDHAKPHGHPTSENVLRLDYEFYDEKGKSTKIHDCASASNAPKCIMHARDDKPLEDE